MSRRIWIVSGPSSAGKSRFLESGRAHAMSGLPRDTRVLHPRDVSPGCVAPGEDAFVHYNILRPAQFMPPDRELTRAWRYEVDPRWLDVAALEGEKRAVVIVADRATLVARVCARHKVEEGDPHAYGVDRWLDVYARVDLDAVYRLWREELDRRRIPWVNVDGGDLG